MGTGLKFGRFAIKPKWALLLLLGCFILSPLLWHWTPRDTNGNRPRDVAKAFIEAVQSNDFVGAASFWKPGTPRYMEINTGMSFEGFCNEIFKCDSYKLGVTTRQKEGLRMVPFRGESDGRIKAWSLYFDKVGGQWRIVENLWTSASDPQPSTTNPPLRL